MRQTPIIGSEPYIKILNSASSLRSIANIQENNFFCQIIKKYKRDKNNSGSTNIC